MSPPVQTKVQNRLLSLMPAACFKALAPALEPVETPKAFVVSRAGQPADFMLFPESGVGSAIAVSRDGSRAEAGMYGREGLAPSFPLLGADASPNDSVVQIAGAGWCLPTEHLLALADADTALRKHLLRYVHTLEVQNGQTALSNALHPIEVRLARWILMCDDRTDGGEMALTHEYISVMLGVRRPSVTTALHALEGAGYIRAERGLILMRNRQAMAEFARNAYGRPEEEYERLIGPLRPPA